MSDQKETYDTILGCGFLIFIGGTIAIFSMYGMEAGGVAIFISTVFIAIGIIISEKLEGKKTKKETYETIFACGFLVLIGGTIAIFSMYGMEAGGVAIFISTVFIAIGIIISDKLEGKKTKKETYDIIGGLLF